MKHKILLLVLFITGMALAQDPYVVPSGRKDQVTKVKGGMSIDSCLTIPVRDHNVNIYHQADSIGRILIDKNTKKFMYHNGDQFVEAGGGSQNLQQTLENGSNATLFNFQTIELGTHFDESLYSGARLIIYPWAASLGAKLGGKESGLYVNGGGGISASYNDVIRFNISQYYTLFSDKVAAYDNEPSLRDWMNDPAAIPSTGKVQQMIAAAGGGGSGNPTLQDVVDNGKVGIAQPDGENPARFGMYDYEGFFTGVEAYPANVNLRSADASLSLGSTIEISPAPGQDVIMNTQGGNINFLGETFNFNGAPVLTEAYYFSNTITDDQTYLFDVNNVQSLENYYTYTSTTAGATWKLYNVEGLKGRAINILNTSAFPIKLDDYAEDNRLFVDGAPALTYQIDPGKTVRFYSNSIHWIKTN